MVSIELIAKDSFRGRFLYAPHFGGIAFLINRDGGSSSGS